MPGGRACIGLGVGAAGKIVAITARDRKALVSLIESYGDKALRAVGLAHKDIKAEDAEKRTELLNPEDLEHDLVLDAIVVSFYLLFLLVYFFTFSVFSGVVLVLFVSTFFFCVRYVLVLLGWILVVVWVGLVWFGLFCFVSVSY